MAKLTDVQRAEITLIKNGLRVSKVVATRAVKTKNGDFFVGLSAAWDSIQEDAGGAVDLLGGMDDVEQHAAIIQQGMTLRQAKIAGLILGMQVDLQAVTHAACGGALSEADLSGVSAAIKRNYSLKMAEVVTSKNGNPEGDAA